MGNTAELTAIAMKAFSLADMFRLAFMAEAVNGAGGSKYKVELTSPDGPTTGGGVQSLQPIKLVPTAAGSTIVVGNVNSVEMVAEIRTFEHMEAVHAQRFRGATFPIEKADYRELQKKLQDFFTERKIAMKLVDAPAAGPLKPGAEPAPPPSALGTLVLALGVVLVLVAAGVYFYLRATHKG